MKLVASLRDLLHQTSQERIYALESTRYDVIKDLQNTYGKLITHTDFYKHFEWLVSEIKRLLMEDGIPEHHKLEKELAEVVDKALSRSLPSTFLCLSMGECVAATVTYFECMATHSHKWIKHFGKEPDKMARRLSESIIRYKQTEKRLESLQSILLNAEKTILPNCVERYANLTQCRQCFADRTSYCRNSCEEVTSDCYLGISGDWDENIAALEHLAKDFSDGFYALERGIHNSLRRLLETTSPDLAQDVVEACGPLEERSTPTRATFTENIRPTVVAKKTERLVQQLQSYRGHWKRISVNFCSEPSTDNFCWNGTNIVRASQTPLHPVFEEQLPEILKNVRPRPRAQSSNCNCRSPENLEKTREHLKLATRISAMKLVASLRDLLHQTSQERIYALESTRYDVIKDLQNTYGKLITHTDFYKHFEWLVSEIKRLLMEDGIPEHHKLEKELAEVVDKALSRSLPSTFLCLSMGECVAATVTYFECMATHSHKWIKHFGKEPDKMARRLSESIIRYKQTEKRLESLQSILLNAEKTILPNCVERYANLTQCRQCFADRTSYCRNSCEEVTSDCYLGISGDWDENIAALEHLAKDFSDGFYALERGIHNSLRRLLETTSPDLAQDVVEACGPLEERSTPTRATFTENIRPTVVAKKTERLVQQLQSYRGHWKRISVNFCSEPSTDNFCWNGTNIVR